VKDSMDTGSASIAVNGGTSFPNEANSITLADLFVRWQIDALPLQKVTSAKRARAALVSLSRIVGNTPLNLVSPETGWRYRKQRHAEGMAAATVHYELRLLRQICRHATSVHGVSIAAPVVHGTLPKLPNRAERWLTSEELRRIAGVAPAYVGRVITFTVETGLRINEICRLSWNQVDLERGELKIGEQKNGKSSLLPLSLGAREVLRVLTTEKKPQGAVFLKGFSPWTDSSLRAAFYKAVKRSGIAPVRFHDLRHTFATRLVQAGVDLYTVQRLGRWSSYDMVQRYGHHNTESLRQALAKVVA